MKIHILSDLHNEFGRLELPPASSDMVVLAGDTDIGIRGLQWVKTVFPDRPVFYVPGNHEYYGNKIPKVSDNPFACAKDTNVTILDDAELVLGATRFLGCTLWADFCLFGDELRPTAMREAQFSMNDYQRIRLGVEQNYRKLRSHDTFHFHRRSLAFLEQKLSEPFHGATVVITHHAPSPRSLDASSRDELVSAAYCSDLEWLILRYGPALWIHGHIHRAVDYNPGEEPHPLQPERLCAPFAGGGLQAGPCRGSLIVRAATKVLIKGFSEFPFIVPRVKSKGMVVCRGGNPVEWAGSFCIS